MRCHYYGITHGPRSILALKRDVQDSGIATVSRRSTRNPIIVPQEKLGDRQRAVHDINQDNNATDREFDAVRTKPVNFHNIRLLVRT